MKIEIEVKLPAGMNQTEAWEYVGGRRAFDLLKAKYPKMVRPALRDGKLLIYRRQSLDEALQLSEQEGQ